MKVTYNTFIKGNYLIDEDLMTFRRFSILGAIKNKSRIFFYSGLVLPDNLIWRFYSWSKLPKGPEYWLNIYQDLKKFRND